MAETKTTNYFRWHILLTALLLAHFVFLTAICWLEKKIAYLELELAKNSAPAAPVATTTVNAPEPVPKRSTESVVIPPVSQPVVVPPTSQEPTVAQAQQYYQQGQVAQTIAQYERLVQQHPNDPQLHWQLGQLYLGQKASTTKAQFHLQKILELDQRHPQKKIIMLWLSKTRQPESSNQSPK